MDKRKLYQTEKRVFKRNVLMFIYNSKTQNFHPNTKSKAKILDIDISA